MNELVALVVGLALGASTAWLLARRHARAVRQAEVQALQARAAAESLVDELRKQLSQRELDLADARAALGAEQARRVEAEARAAAARENLDEQRRWLDEARQRLGDTFRALGAEALRDSGAALVAHARDVIDAQLARRQEAMDALVRPLEEALRRYEAQVQALEATRQRAWGSLEEQLQALAQASAALQRETGNLVTALRGAPARGRWGELTLRRVVELAGLVEHCDFEEQVVASGEHRARPDLVVRLPGGRQIVVDAKVPLAGYLDAIAAASAEERAAALARHAQQVRQHLNDLASRAYWEQFGGAAELVVMFIPGEAFVAAAVQADPALLEDGIARRVVIATPTTLIALLRAIAFGWRQEQLAANAERVSELGRQLYDRLRTLGRHFDELGRALRRATDAFNAAVASMETRVLPAARRFRDLGAGVGPDIPPLEAVDEQPRTLAAPEFPRQLDAPELGA